MQFTLEGFGLLQLTFAEVGLNGTGKLLGDDANYLRARAFGQLAKLVKGVLETP